MLLSGDREAEVRYLADEVGISEVLFSKSPEEKVAIVKEETRRAPTLFVGDGINDAPAMQAATVGVAFGQKAILRQRPLTQWYWNPHCAKWTSLFTSAAECAESLCKAQWAEWP